MTKRFTAIREKNPILKKMDNYIQNDGTTILELSSFEDCKDVVDVLNEFDCEFKQLQEENEQLKNDCGILVQSNQDYRKENEQLKQLVNIADDLIDKLGSETMQNEWIKNF
jgi:cell shape-determining protein MreC